MKAAMRDNPLLKNVIITPNIREEVSWRAYMHYVNSGGRHGNDLAHWYQAETEVLLEHMICATPADHDDHVQSTSPNRPINVGRPVHTTPA